MANKRILEYLYNASLIGTTSKENEKVLKDYYKVVLRDLNRLEKLEKDIKEYRKAIKTWNENGGKLLKENIELKKAIEILKDKIELPLENDFDVVNKDDIHLYRLRTKCLINEEEYELLKGVLVNER